MEHNLLRFLQDLSLNKQYKTECTKYIDGIEYTESDFQVYNTINDQHLYNVTEFIMETLENNAKNARVTIKNNNREIILIITDNAGKKVLRREIKGE